MRKSLFILFSLLFCISAEARHIIGGEVIYQYLRPGFAPGSRVFRITLRLFRDENSMGTGVAPLPISVSMGVFNNDNNVLFGGYRNINRSSDELVPPNPLPLCISNAPNLSYRVGYYPFEVELPSNATGYTATFQTCCRIDNINNTSNSVGATYTGRIPALNDNSPVFNMGIDVICFEKPFTFNFSAVDPDPQDSLVYSICDAYNGGDAIDASFATPAAPPYASIPYTNGFTGGQPLGPLASINRQTGIISGIAPVAGKYVICVCISVYRNGLFIAQHRKDFIVSVAACDFAGAELEPDYLSCDGFAFSFFNLNSSPLNQTFQWNFGDTASGTSNISNSPNPNHSYTDTGVYKVKLVVNGNTPCSDTAETLVRVYPGFFPGFTALSPVCKGAPVVFTDTTYTRYGNPNFWNWNFGDPSRQGDTSLLQFPQYSYQNAGTYTATLIVGSDKGCQDTVTRQINVIERPALQISNDTLICVGDSIQLFASSSLSGNFTWSPNQTITDTLSSNPFVFPVSTTRYYVAYADNFGCAAIDSVTVNVIDSINVFAGNDTTICRTDAIVLPLVSNALYFQWIPANTLNNPNIKNPIAIPTDDFTTYTVIAKVSNRCFKQDDIRIKTVPYPNGIANGDTTICLGGSAALSASGGSIYSWTPSLFLNASNISNPVVSNPDRGLQYIVAIRDTLGCPKPVFDSVRVIVLQIIANAGPRDTSIVFGQPLQLQATGGSSYLWTPSTWLNNSNISNPVSNPENNIQYVVKVTDGPGCIGYDTINVNLFRIPADIMVPNAFTPNGDGINDIIRPLTIGMKSLDVFRVYNRWGQLVFSTSEMGKGWDGNFRGNPQSTATFVWYAEGTTYYDEKIFRKGYVVLIR